MSTRVSERLLTLTAMGKLGARPASVRSSKASHEQITMDL